ncbi:MAG: hypothetical protein EPO24_12705 [Bacteroidetes bacterium]|nr:MAG: hypothetical protein EPO24_12705 [Bacteroidota bacterium]
MKRQVLITILFFTVIFVPTVRCEEKTETIEIKKSLNFSGSTGEPNSLLVDNVNGSIEVTGYDGTTVELIVHETIVARSERKLEEAKQKVNVDITEEGDRILLYVDGPWRRANGECDYRGSDYYGYEVQCDFELKIPRSTKIELKTVNDGAITVSNIEAGFIVTNVNGDVRIRDVSGSGKAHTVNGDVEVSFKKNPTEKSSFKTINGEVDVKFQENLSADLEFKTLNGEVYSDFNVTSLPVKAATEKRRNGKRVYSRGDSFSVRVANGGPELSFNTINGDITVAKY